MELQRLAVQNKLDVSKTAVSWLMEVKNELYINLWSLEHFNELEPAMINNVVERAKKLDILGAEARDNFNAIELYYNLDDIVEKYNLLGIISQMLTLQNLLAVLNNIPYNSNEEYDKAMKRTLFLFRQLHNAVTDVIERIRQDNLEYLN